MVKKSKPPKFKGHYCKVCGERKANENFSGKGHTAHICKACHKLPVIQRNELIRLRIIERMDMSFHIPQKDLDTIIKYAKDKRYPEAAEHAQGVLDRFIKHDITEELLEPIAFSELDNEYRDDITELLFDYIDQFIIHCGYIPRIKDKDVILDELCADYSKHYFECDNIKVIVQDKLLRNMFDKILREIINIDEAEGIKIKTYGEYLKVMETERLIIRKLDEGDFSALYSMMSKTEVMYAWVHGFNRGETKKWLKTQLKRYKKDGYGYFAVILKESDKFIGQAGLMKTSVDGREVIELGYILDDAYWHNGYATESAMTCLKYGFNKLGANKILAAIRPENKASIAVAERLGMAVVGEYDKEYNGENIRHLIFSITKNQSAKITL